MNYLMKFVFALSALISLIILILFFLSLIAWISGGGNVLFPGLGLVVAMSVIVILLFILVVISVSFTMLLYKSIAAKKMLRNE